MRTSLKITLLIDEEYFHEADPQFLGLTQRSKREMEFFVSNSLRKSGHKVSVLPFTEPLLDFIFKLQNLRPDLVFNLIQHYRSKRRGEAYIPALLDLLNLRYTGPDSYGVMQSIDKRIAKDVLSKNFITVPDYVELTKRNKITSLNLRFPVVVKPNYEGGSEGITLRNFVKTRSQLSVVSKAMLSKYPSIIIESFVEGKEVTVGLVGNKNGIRVFHPRELVFQRRRKQGEWITTMRVKDDISYRKKHGIFSRDLKCDQPLLKKIRITAIKAFNLLQIRDYARIDMRITSNDEVYVIDVNTNPTLKPDSHSLFAPWKGLSFDALIQRIVETSINRQR